MIRAVLFDRDGTLVADGTQTLMPGAASSVSRLREHGLRIGVVTNQPRAGESEEAYHAMRTMHERIEDALGVLDGWFVCTHAPSAGCTCRKPAPGLVRSALAAFGVAPHECVVIGDIGSDMQAAQRAGAFAIMVPTPVTRQEEVAAAPLVCANLLAAVEAVLHGRAAA